jgi:LPS-assembly protein
MLLLLFTCFAGGRAFGEEPGKKVPVTVKADKLDYDRTSDVYIAEGNVKVEQEGMRVEADRIILNNRTGEASAEGKVYLQEKGDIIRADRLQLNINTKAGVIYNGDLFMSKDNLHLKGDRIERKSETVYHIENGRFTTCDENEWYLSADELDVDMDRYATGRGVSFNMAGLPVFYTPYLLFPVRRQTGLLIPEMGYSSSEGFLMKNSFFWAISDYTDMTFYSDYRARHGLGTALEYRYVNSNDSKGNVFLNFFDTFNRYRPEATPLAPPDKRWLLSYEHYEEIAEDLSVRADINLVSDYAYFRDLEKKLELTSQPYLDSNLFYVERWETASLYLLGQYATDLTRDGNETTIQKLPELRYTIFEEKIAGPLHANFDASAANFTRREGANVMRADFNPRLSAPLNLAGLTFTPRFGVRGTYYDRSLLSVATGTALSSAATGTALSSEPTNRTYYYAGLDLNARFSRVYGADADAGFGRIRHSIEPSIVYSFIPRMREANLPQFDTIDTIAQQNTVSVALINRLTARYKDAAGTRSFDMLVFRLSESYDIKKVRSEESSVSSQARSPEVRSELFIKTPKALTLSASESYDTFTHAFTSSSESINISAEKLRFNASHQYLREPKTKYLIGGAGATVGKWDFDGQLWRDMLLKQITQHEYKVHYAAQCWGVGIMFVKKPGETQYLFTLDLKGLGALKF